MLAKSDVCSIQAMRIGLHAWSMQYHVEIEPDTIDNWGAIPAYAQALEETLGEGALPRLKQDADKSMSLCLHSAQTIYKNFMQAIN